MIDPNKTYRTRDGRTVRIYAADGTRAEPIHGAIWSGEEQGWSVYTWNKRGQCYPGLIDPHNFDLIEVTLADELRDQIPWSALRPEMRWAALQPNGLWYGFFGKRPEAYAEWHDYTHRFACVSAVVVMPEVDPARWRETLVKRPDDFAEAT